MSTKAKAWTPEELEILKQCSTVDEAAERIPDRSRGAIETKAKRIGVEFAMTETTESTNEATESTNEATESTNGNLMDKFKALQEEIQNTDISEEERAELEKEFKTATKGLKGMNEKDKALIEFMCSEINDNAVLPSTKVMAETLGWNYATVMDHLKSLQTMGYVEYQRKGVWVPTKDLEGKRVGLCLAEIQEED